MIVFIVRSDSFILERIIKMMLKIDTVIHNTNLPQIKERLEQAGIQHYSVCDVDSGNSKHSFYTLRSKIEIICKNSQKDTTIEAISGLDDGGIIYVNQLTTHIQLNSDNSKK
ncbi:hypothetical protein NITUZ_30201 [Candidatus Nitrosotenuis uzonensis]|uniref:Nitrogen regulatory protein P-II n=1 Tax=Candidatus Nitrosotenuis uzonensis TaxID=1407055 RepID=V6ASE8_9ARCH|nr:hypothetical protein NITUZ_30201 [Candidatus Nitrosotenuis uzonensis]